MKFRHWLITLTLVIVFFSIYCINCSRDEHLITRLTERENFNINLLLESAPSTVVSIVGFLERSGFTSIQRNFVISGDTASADFGEVIAGTWHLTVSAYDSSFQELYHGETDVTIIAGQLNTVYLTLNPVTGGLIVIVNWGTQQPGDYVYTYNFRNGPLDIYRYNFQTSLLERLTNSGPCEFPVYVPHLSKVGYQRPYIHEFWFMNPDGSNQTYFFSMNFDMEKPSYSNGSQKSCFYLIENGFRRLGMMDYDGSNFQYLTPPVYYNNATPDINESGSQILFQSDQGGVYNIYLLNLSNMTKEQLTFNSVRSVYPQWSEIHNGFYYLRESSNLVEIIYYSFTNNASTIVLSLNQPYIIDYVFSPNEDEVALICSESWSLSTPRNLYLYDISNQTLTQKTYTNLSFDDPQWYQF